MVKKDFPLVAVAFVTGFWILAACATPVQPGASSNPVAYGTAGARMVSDSAATLQAATAVAYEQQIVATRQAQSATIAAQEIANATMGAMIVTRDAQEVRQRDMELAGMATATAVANNAQATATAIGLMRDAMDVQAEAQLVAQESSARATAQARELERLQLDNDMRRFWNGALPWITAVVMIVLVGAAGGTFYIRFMDAHRPPVYSMPVQLDHVPMFKGPNGWQALPARTATVPGNDIEEGVFMDTDTVPAKWDSFVRWQHQSQLPIGAVVDSQRRPMLVDRNEHPHLLIAGKSGGGKTLSGMIPCVLGMWASGAHVVIVNGAGSDFAPLENIPNISFFPRADERDLIRPLSEFLNQTLDELQRRDRVLARYGARTWRDLPIEIGEAGEILIAVDEFLAIILAAEEMKKAIAASPDFNSNAERRTAIAEIDHMVYQMWSAANKLASKSRKHGIHLLMTLTDPTERLLGKEGMSLRRHSLAVAFRMGTSGGSRAFLDTSRGDYPQGSVGLPTGQFLVNLDGQINRCVSFYPSRLDIQRFVQVRGQHVVYNDLPSGLQLSDGDIAPSTHLPQSVQSSVERDADMLRGRIRDLRSATSAGRILGLTRGDLSPGVNPSTKQIDDARAALKWLSERGDLEARAVLEIIEK
ncbi:MAG: hypothetical protein IPK53_03605 [bacterium]|nr:hypothetical protein [bacterium]